MMGYWSDDPSDWPASPPHVRFDCGLDNARWCEFNVNRTEQRQCRFRPTAILCGFRRCHRGFLIAGQILLCLCDHPFSLKCYGSRR